MKKITLLSLCFVSLYAGAQTLKLETGKKITGTSSVVIDMDMGMAGQMKITTASTNVVNITGSDDKSYTGTNTITKLKVSQAGMGQDTEFDSEKKEDADSEAGKLLGQNINMPQALRIEKATGKSEDTGDDKKEDAEGNPMAGIMGGMNSNSGAGAAFFVIPAGKKVGDKWSDSTSEKGLKNVNNYELKSMTANLATIDLKSISSGTMNQEAQGMQIDMTMNTVTTGLITVDPRTSLVKNRSTSGDMTGNMEVMGQSIPITSKLTTTSVFE